MTTIEKIKKEIEKNKAKIADIQKKSKASVAEVQKKIKTLEAQLTEEENLQIVQMVKTVNLDNKEYPQIFVGFHSIYQYRSHLYNFYVNIIP